MNAAAEKKKESAVRQKERETIEKADGKSKADQAAKVSTETQKDDLLPNNDDIVQNLVDH